MHSKAIGILGGMGPEASSFMLNILIKMAIEEFGAKNNDEFPEIILYSIPVPDFISSEEDKDTALQMLIKRVKDLNALNISSLSIACNTAHILLPQLQKASKIPFVSMIDAVVNQVKFKKIKKVGLLGTPSTIRASLYQQALEKMDIQTIIPTDQDIIKLEKIIREVIGGNQTKQKSKIIKIADNLKSRGVEGIILGCTELPLIFPEKYSLPVFSSLNILSRVLLNIYYQKS